MGNRRTLIRADGVIHTKVKNNIQVTVDQGNLTLDSAGEFYVGLDGAMFSSLGKFGGTPMNSRWRIGDELQCWYQGYGTNRESKGVFAIGPKGYMGSYWIDGSGTHYAWRITSNGTAYFQKLTVTSSKGDLSSNFPWKNAGSNYTEIDTTSDFKHEITVDLDNNENPDSGSINDVTSSDLNDEITGTIVTDQLSANTDITADEVFARRVVIGKDSAGNDLTSKDPSDADEQVELKIYGNTISKDFCFNTINENNEETIESLKDIIESLQNEIKSIKERLDLIEKKE